MEMSLQNVGILEALAKCPLMTGVISRLNNGTLSKLQAHKQKVSQRSEELFHLKWKWTRNSSERWDEIICCAEEFELAEGWRGGGGWAKGKLADSHEFKEATLQG